MKDYTPEGIKQHQMDLTVSYLHLIDKKLKKTNKYLGIIAGVSLVSLAFKFKAFKELIGMKGE